MDFELTSDHVAARDRVADFADTHVGPNADVFDRDQALPAQLVESLGAAGFLGSLIGEEYGGSSSDLVSYGLLHEELGKHCSSTRSLVTVHDMVAESISRLGTPEQKEQWLPRLATGEVVGAFALTEPSVGSDASSIATVATRDGAGYRLDGEKQWISFAQLADLILVVARLEDGGGTAGFLVPADTEGLSIEPMRDVMGLRASMLGKLTLASCHVPAESLVGSIRMPPGLVVATALQIGRYGVAWGCVGISSASVDAAYRYADDREQFGSPIGRHQLIQQLLTDMVVGNRTSRLLCLEAGHLIGGRRPGAVGATLVAKYHASRAAMDAARDALQIHGAYGTSEKLPLQRRFRDAKVMEIIEGSTQILQFTIPKHARRAYGFGE